MTKNIFPLDTFTNPVIHNDGVLNLYPDFLPHDVADNFYELFLNALNWSEEHIQMFGKTIPVPRLICWYGNKGAIYRYSGVEHIPYPWTKSLWELKNRIEAFTQFSFNSVLGNLYRDGNDAMGWHSDDEKELGQNPFIASISLGAERVFKIRHKSTREQYKLTLPHGSLLTMSGPFQHHWQHSIPRTSTCKTPRINLTFRNIKH
ncbi:alpha-ketoglutarate-dependent dioxygenase AlkB family protein [Kaarinaea lacus]